MKKLKEKIDAILEFHIGDCSCEEGKACKFCTMSDELTRIAKAQENIGFQKAIDKASAVANNWHCGFSPGRDISKAIDMQINDVDES